jgi:tricorn protease interacting factor F2/3
MDISKYDITLDIDFRNLKYKGTEIISVKGQGEKFYLNSVALDIKSVFIDGKSIPFTINQKEETVETDYVINGESSVKVDFQAEIGKTLQGLYIANYQEGYMLTTQFESTGARRAFPCIDHPNYKAVFSLKLNIDGNLEAISNMPVLKEEKQADGKKLVEFQETPRMSTYLLYMGVGEFDHMEMKLGGISGILSAPKGHLLTTDFPLKEAGGAIRFFEDYYGIDFALPKVHLISVPEFGAGAMENWGAITFREVLLLTNENTSASVRQTISEVISHELAHQWFGDLVTMKWWNDLWLNESFATFMAHKAVASMHPDWHFFGKFLITETAGAFTGDSLHNTHPIDADVKSPDDIAQIFDEISYGKGASILRMIEGYVGAENFRDGIRKYLQDNKYGNAKGSDLWSSIEHVSGMPVSKVMEAWIQKKGYPVLKVKRNGDRLHISQERFMLNGIVDGSQWPVPITILREHGIESALMDSKEMDLDAKGFIKLNADQTGFYRVLYETDLMSNLNSRIEKLSYLDAWGIVNDYFAFLKAGKISLSQYLDGIKPFTDLKEYVVAQELAGQFFTLSLLLPEHAGLIPVVKAFYQKHLSRLGEKKEGEDENDSVLRGTIALNLAMVDSKYTKELSPKIESFFSIDPDVRQAVAVAYADETNDFEKLEKILDASKTDEDRIKLISGMSWLKGEENFRKLVNLIENGKIKKQDSVRVYLGTSMNPDQRTLMYTHMTDAVRTVEKYFRGTGYTGMMLEAIIPFLGLGREDEIKKYLETIREDAFSKGIDKGEEILEIYSRLVSSSH